MSTHSPSLEALRAIVGPEFVKDDPDILSACAVDGLKPRAVLYPGSTEEVAGVVRLAHGENLSLLARGSGSKMAVGNVPERLDLIVATERLNRVVDLDTANLTVTVEAGVPFREIQSALAGEENRGCFVPMMPPYRQTATLGGIVAANSSGPTRLLYGLPRDMVLGVRYVTPAGEIVGMGGKTVKNVSGYDVSKLMIGSYGSLGILCEMTLRLLPLPESVGTGLFPFADLEDASRFVDRIFETALLPAAVELLNKGAYDRLVPQGAPGLEKEGYGVAVALEGVDEAVGRMAAEFREMGSAAGARGYHYLEREGHDRFWEETSNLGERLSARFPGLVSVRVMFPISGYRDIIGLAGSLVPEGGPDCAIFSHAGSGVVVIHLLLPQGDDDSDMVINLVEGILGHCREVGGNLVVERAVPALKGSLPLWGLPPDDLVVMKRLKEQMDPLGLLSPGRFVGGI
jgi:FAD/FMN-containing dehydrogenase